MITYQVKSEVGKFTAINAYVKKEVSNSNNVR